MDEGVLQYRCAECDRYYFDHEVRRVQAGTGFLRVCPSCGAVVHPERSRVVEPFPLRLLGAFAFPVRPGSLLWIGAVSLAVSIAAIVPFIGWLIVLCIDVGFLFAVLRSTAAGHDEIEASAEDMSSVFDWIGPLVRYLLAAFTAFFPALMSMLALRGAPGGDAVAVVLALLGVLYLPASMIVAVHGVGCLGAVNPIPAVVLIGRIPKPYAITVAMLAAALIAGVGIHFATAKIAKALVEVPILPTLAVNALRFYAPMVGMRMLGLLVHEHGEEL